MPNPLIISADWHATLAGMGLTTVESLLSDPRIVVWRSLPERQNATLDTPQGRLHVKRYVTAAGAREAQAEIAAASLLAEKDIPAITFAAHGQLDDGRAVTATEDLATFPGGGYVSAQEFMRKGGDFSQLLQPTARLAALLHTAGFHHRDLYLCHFFFAPTSGHTRLIDIARVRPLPRFFARRWIVKDLAQFVYSLREFNLSKETSDAWLREYHLARGMNPRAGARGPIYRKVEAIARHDANLKAAQPDRNVSLRH